MNTELKTYNGEIDFWKFIFSIIIVLHHSYCLFGDEIFCFRYGSLAVEFFFIISGYFLASSVMRNQKPYDKKTIGSETASFVFKKGYALIYYMMFSVVLKLIVLAATKGFKETILNKKIFLIITDVLFLNMSGIPAYKINAPIWYISAMLLAMMVIYPLLRKNSDFFVSVISPLTAIFLYGFMMKHDTYLGSSDLWYSAVYKGVLRAFAGLALGCFVFKLSQSMKNQPLFCGGKKFTPHILSALELIAMFGAVYSTYKMGIDDIKFQPIVVMVFSFGFIICTSKAASISHMFKFKFFKYLGKLSTTIFICQAPVIELLKYANSEVESVVNFTKSFFGKCAITGALAALSVLFAVICLAICDPLKKNIDNRIKQRQ